jgi:parvulin-like peptidyl-prolyl isomerase
MRTRSLSIAAMALAACGLVLSACGGSKHGGSGVPSDAVAVADGTPITRSQFDALWKSTVKQYPAEGRKVPKAGTTEYSALRNQLLESLIQEVATEKKAEQDFGLRISAAELDAQIRKLKARVFGGSEERYRRYLAARGETDALVRASIKSQLLSGRVAEALGKKVRVSGAEVEAYYRGRRPQYREKSLAEVKDAIRQVLFKQKRDEAYGRWFQNARRELRSKIRYAKGFSAP